MITGIFKNKKLVITLLSLALVLIVATGGTFAYLTTATREETNIFTGADNIRARLTEPNWEGEEALRMVPGKTVKKDPMITNTGLTDEYVAIRLTFQDGGGGGLDDADLLRLLNLVEIDWSSKWILCDGTMTVDSSTGEVTAVHQQLVFYYDEALSPGQISDPIFSSIRVKDKVTDGEGAITEDDLRWLQGVKIADGETADDPDGLGGFYIQVEGAAVQTVSLVNAASAANELKALFP